MNPGRDRFTTTRWSIVLSAGRSSSPKYREALAALCETYWYPLYVFLRRQGHDAHAAEDFVQAFFARMLEKHDFRLADPERGKFRSFLLAALKNFVANELDRASAQKRGGGQRVLSLDVDRGEELYVLEPVDTTTPETLFERAWAMTVIDRAMAQLEAAVGKTGEHSQFDLLKRFLTGDESTVSYKEASAQLGMSEGAVKVAVHRLRRRFREALKDEVAQTVGDEGQIDEEIRHLIGIFAQ